MQILVPCILGEAQDSLFLKLLDDVNSAGQCHHTIGFTEEPIEYYYNFYYMHKFK